MKVTVSRSPFPDNKESYMSIGFQKASKCSNKRTDEVESRPRDKETTAVKHTRLKSVRQNNGLIGAVNLIYFTEKLMDFQRRDDEYSRFRMIKKWKYHILDPEEYH